MRDMQKELSEWRQRKAVAAPEDNASKCLRKTWRGGGRGSVLGKENNLFTFADTPRKGCEPSTPSTTCRRHIKSESPLMEMCQNGTRRNYLGGIHHTWSPASIRRPGPLLLNIDALQSADLAMEEQTRVQPIAPPNSPVAVAAARTRSQSRLEKDCWERDPDFVASFLASTMTDLATVVERFRNDVSPRQSQTHPGNSHDFVVFNDEANEQQVGSTCVSQGTSLADFLPAQTASVPLHIDQEDLQQLLKELQEAKDEVGVEHDEDVHEIESQHLDEDDHARTLRRLREHKLVEWGPPILLDSEDFLSRAYNWDLFWFFEKRERCANHLGDDFEKLEDRCAEIYEYNPEWPQWRREEYEREVALEDQRYREACAMAGSVCY